MKTIFLSLFILVSSVFSYTTGIHGNAPTVENEQQKINAYKAKFTISCSPDLASLNFEDSTNTIPLLDGWGSYRMPVTVSDDSASIYFEQGINMYYGFHIIEALASFDKATKFDSGFAMGYWGKALAYGPNINDFGYRASPDALTAVAKAKQLAINSSPVEKALIEAMEVRYSADTTKTREHLNQLYADAMNHVYNQFKTNADAGALYADALMVQHPWDLYDKYGKPKTWTPPIVSVLETVLKLSPKHPGASHYYIHAIEASDHPEKGLVVAKQLPSLMPGLAHLVHMPSHIYIRSGYYKEGAEVNQQSVNSYQNYLNKYAPVANNTPLYLIHNLHMQSACANMDGRFAEALKISNDCKNSFDTSWLSMPAFTGVFVQYLYMQPYLTFIRFGKWDDILNSPAIPYSLVYANILWHYGRGLAYARKHDFTNANNELNKLQEDMKNEQLKAEAPAYANEGIVSAGVAEKVLQGIIAEESNDLPKAIALLRDGAEKEDNMQYNEPKDWIHPVRQYLGNVLLKAKQFAEAEKVYKEDLKVNPHNGWSLTGLAIALEKQGKKTQAALTKTSAAKAFARSDIKVSASVF